MRQILCAFAPTLAFTSMEVSQLRSHLVKVRENGVTQEELIETNTHLAFYAGWPNAVIAIGELMKSSRRNEFYRGISQESHAKAGTRKEQLEILGP